jgi:hypothetical protein
MKPEEMLERMARAWYIAGLSELGDDENAGEMWDESVEGFKRSEMKPIQAALRELVDQYLDHYGLDDHFFWVTVRDITELEL